MAPANEFRIVTRWQVTGTLAEVAAILTDAESLPRWWGAVYLGIDLLDKGDANGIGSRVRVHSKGWLPYRLTWTGTLVTANMPHTWSIAATGDLTGTGVWTLTQQGAEALVEYDWRVTADKPILRLLSPLLAPIFAWNHRWAMAKGEAGLRRELVRRRAT